MIVSDPARAATPHRQSHPAASTRAAGRTAAWHRLGARLLLAERARPLRFAAVGGVCALLQLGLLVVLLRCGLNGIAANTAAYLLSAQVNFALSDRFIWHDRRTERRGAGVARRWTAFHLSIAGTFLLNEAVFIVARLVLPDLVAAAAGIASAAIVNFLIQDALTFR